MESGRKAAEYPRPQLVREGWKSLDGRWSFEFDDEDVGEKEMWFQRQEGRRDIFVPYAYETAKSGIGDPCFHPVVWYWKKVSIEDWYEKGRHLVLHFEGCDYEARVWVNGQYVGDHQGGYTRFSFDLGIMERNELFICVRAADTLSEEQIRGKQRWKNESYGCWYVQTTGIWKSVWMEMVPEVYVDRLRMSPDIERAKLHLNLHLNRNPAGKTEAECTVLFEGKKINQVRGLIRESALDLDIDVYDKEVDEWGAALWTPEHPYLYDLTVEIFEDGKPSDQISSYFGMREIDIEGSNILLNREPLYQRLILDQGYWKESGLTPCGDRDLLRDIEKIQALGYNGVRKHQKTENERFLYWCDVKGLLVWEESPSFYRYSPEAAVEFVKQWTEIVEQNYNHPSVVVWTPVNESWGVMDINKRQEQQSFTQMVYHLTKCLDPMRPVVVNDGWEHTVSDIITLHDYEEDGVRMEEKYRRYQAEILSGELYHNDYRKAFADGFSYRGQPVMISEYGGIAFDSKDQNGWGYGSKAKDEEEFMRRFAELTQGIKRLPYVCGYCYTQLADVQQEINGLLTEEREFKVDPDKIREVNESREGIFSTKNVTNI